MKLALVFSPRAEHQIDGLVDWWMTNRPDSTTSLGEKLAGVFDLLLDNPRAGIRYSRSRIPGLRQFPVKGTPYVVYYAVDVRAQELRIVAVWSGNRGEAPPL